MAFTDEVVGSGRSAVPRPEGKAIAMSKMGDSLRRQIGIWQPRCLVAVGDDARTLLQSHTGAATRCEIEFLETQDAAERLLSVENERTYDVALLAGYLENVDRTKGGAVIARLRDVLARRLCVLVAMGEKKASKTNWSDSELSAFGLTLLSRYQEDGKLLRLYGFDIASYKQTPDWLSPRHWAHPEMWGKFRW